MSRITEQEIAVTQRFDEFVVSHVAQSAIWFMVSKERIEPKSVIHHVEFNVEHSGPAADSEQGSYLFLMDVFTGADLELETSSVAVEHPTEKRVRIADMRKELDAILGGQRTGRRRNWVRSTGLLLDHLTALQETDYFVPAHKRYAELAA
jgi:hypothetical protein